MRLSIIRTYDWLVHRGGYLLLAGEDEKLAQQSPRRFVRAWAELMLLSLGWGLASVGLWGAAWSIFGDYSGIPYMPVMAVVIPMALWLYRRSFIAAGQMLGGAGGAGQNMVIMAGVLLLAMSLLGLRRLWDSDWPTYLPAAWQWICPIPLYRVLILCPLWGGWAMIVTCQFCRATDRTEPAVAAFARGCGPLATALCLAVLLAATLLYLHFLGWWRLAVPAVAIVVAIAGGILLTRKSGGLGRTPLLACNLLTQQAFLLAYLANR